MKFVTVCLFLVILVKMLNIHIGQIEQHGCNFSGKNICGSECIFNDVGYNSTKL